MSVEPLIKRIVGPNPKAAGLSGEQQTQALKRRIRNATGFMIVTAIVGAACIYVLTR